MVGPIKVTLSEKRKAVPKGRCVGQGPSQETGTTLCERGKFNMNNY